MVTKFTSKNIATVLSKTCMTLYGSIPHLANIGHKVCLENIFKQSTPYEAYCTCDYLHNADSNHSNKVHM